MKAWVGFGLVCLAVSIAVAAPTPKKPKEIQQKSAVPDLQAADLRALDARAKLGDVAAQVDLGIIYFEGKRVPQNLVLAQQWWTLAAQRGNEVALANLRLLNLKDEEEQEGGVSFYGTAGKGRVFAFVIDKSGSMTGEPFRAAKLELIKCMKQLPANSRFMIYFFDDDVEPLPVANAPAAVPANFKWVEKWILERETGGGTDPRSALTAAFQFKPDTIWILTDGEFSNAEDTVRQIKHANPRKHVRVNTIAFYNRASEDTLKTIANGNDGKYRFVDR